MHVVLSGYYGFDNVGDEAILYAIIEALKNNQPSIKITVLSNNPEATKAAYQVEAVNRQKLSELIRALKAADGLISGGGSLLQDTTGMKSIPYYTSIMLLAKFYKVPVFVYAQGIGPINRKLNRRLVAFTLNKIDRLTVRDPKSKQLLQNLGVKQDVSVVPDPAFVLGGEHFEYRTSFNKKRTIVVSVRNWKGHSHFKKHLAICLDELASDGYTILFLPMHANQDEIVSLEIAQEMKAKSEVVSSSLSIKEKLELIANAQLLIGIRLHALIFSAITYTPFVAISYDPKIDAFAEMFNETVVGHVSTEDWDSEVLYSTINEKLENSSHVKKLLKQKVNVLYYSATNTAKDALEVFRNSKA
ncbi:polysaccharide pyruvyl transferase CsaB [Oceanobacillus sp. CAU 1775]